MQNAEYWCRIMRNFLFFPLIKMGGTAFSYLQYLKKQNHIARHENLCFISECISEFLLLLVIIAFYSIFLKGTRAILEVPRVPKRVAQYLMPRNSK